MRITRRQYLRFFPFLIVLGGAGFLLPPPILDHCGDSDQLVKLFVASALDAALLKFKIDNGRYPTTEEGLEILVQVSQRSPLLTSWRGPYLKKIPIDPWNQAYHYAFPATGVKRPYAVWSNGPDGVPSADDIGNWD